MRKIFTGIVAIIMGFIFTSTSCDPFDALEETKITMTTTKSGRVAFWLTLGFLPLNNSYTISIDWGDGTIEEGTIHGIESWVGFHHTYSNSSVRTITITGNNISGFRSFESEITHLDLSNVPKLTNLDCSKNLLVHLDISRNAKLFSLICNDNQLIKLDLSQNSELDWVNCSNNLLTCNSIFYVI
jgi:Leucine-rich repeat (LRR) protein